MNFGKTTIQPIVCYLPSPPQDSKALERLGTTALVHWAPSEAADRQAALGGSLCHGACKPAAGKETEAWLAPLSHSLPSHSLIQIWPGCEFLWGTAAVSKAGGAVRMAACPQSVHVTWSPTGSAFAQPLYQSSYGQKSP